MMSRGVWAAESCTRIRAFPFGDEVVEFLDSHERHFVVEQNRDGQLRALLSIELGIAPDTLVPILDYGGMPLAARVVVDDASDDDTVAVARALGLEVGVPAACGMAILGVEAGIWNTGLP